MPDECSIEIDRRLIPGEVLADVQRGYDEFPERLREQFPDLDISQTLLLSDWPTETATNAGIVRTVCDVLAEAHLEPKPVGVPFGSDESKLVRVGIPSVVLGPGSIDQAHTANDFVAADEVVKAASLYEQIIRRFQPRDV